MSSLYCPGLDQKFLCLLKVLAVILKERNPTHILSYDRIVTVEIQWLELLLDHWHWLSTKTVRATEAILMNTQNIHFHDKIRKFP